MHGEELLGGVEARAQILEVVVRLQQVVERLEGRHALAELVGMESPDDLVEFVRRRSVPVADVAKLLLPPQRSELDAFLCEADCLDELRGEGRAELEFRIQ